MSETLIKAPERAVDSTQKPLEKAFTDDNAMGTLKLSQIQDLNGQSKKTGEGWFPVTDDKSLVICPIEKAAGEKPPVKEAPGTDIGAKEGKVGIPEETDAFKAYERLNPKIEAAFPGDDEKSRELKRAALTYVMNKETKGGKDGFGDKLKPEQLELLKNTPGALDKLDKISFESNFPNHLSDSKLPVQLDMGDYYELYTRK